MRTINICLSIILFQIAGIHQLNAASPIITNVVASQRVGTKLVDIHYDISDADGDPLKIRIEISHNGGTNYSVPAASLTGDIGNNIAPGTNKLIIWNAGVDWDGEFSPKMRVKVIASDSRGYPGLQWGQEVAPGGFLLGQDGGAEGVGPAKHVNIPYSFWLSKYEITVAQFTDFLNTALVAGELFRSGNNIYANSGFFIGVPAGTGVYYLGGDIQWNLNKLEILDGRANLPIVVDWPGAIAFAQHYGYDLPTHAEWEKAARGPGHDGLGEHFIYPWGNSIVDGDANFANSGRTPVGYYNGNQVPPGVDRANGYGLYDILGNVGEWTRTHDIATDAYPATESLTNSINDLTTSGSRTYRGGGYANSPGPLYYRSWGAPLGFRVARRSQ